MSGGLDSFYTSILLARKGVEFDWLHCYMEPSYAEAKAMFKLQLHPELKGALKKARESSALEGLHFLGAQHNIDAWKARRYIPNRNLILASVAAGLGYQTIWMGGLHDDHVADKTPKAFKAMGEALSITMDRPIEVKSALWRFTKTGMVTDMVKTKVGSLWMRRSISCYHPIELNTHTFACGACPSCFRKWLALKANGIESQKWFDTPPGLTPLAFQYRSKALAGVYTGRRRIEILTHVKAIA